MKLISIPALTNNYIWILHNNTQCIIIDPGEYQSVLQKLKTLNNTPVAIFLTHYHKDHIDGVPELLSQYKIPIYGPKEIQKKTKSTIMSNKFTTINILNLKFKIFSLPGHTPEHIGFYNHPWLFCGDTIFSAGCERIYKGAEKKMYQSLQKIKKLNKNTLICAGHEYTLSNIEFAISIMPHDKELISYRNYIKKIRDEKKSSLPSKLQHELKINLFLRCHETILKNKLGFSSHEKEWKIFSKLKEKKDNYSTQSKK